MIVTSYRCFMNVLTQLWNVDQLLNANYYIADCGSPSMNVSLTESVRYNDYGQVIEDDPISRTSSVVVPGVGRYNIKYSNGGLNPERYRADCLMGVNDDYSSSYDKFIKNLNNPETMMEVYNFLFKNPVKGNGVQILIYFDDQNLLNYGNIVCQYLAKNFGVDIIFIDPQYRPNCRGYAEYRGDKVLGEKTMHDIRDYELLFNFSQSVSCADMYNNVSNLTVFLSEFGFNDLIYLYNLLFPDDPLPPGNYTEDHLRRIIIDRASVGISRSPLPNLTALDWRTLLDRYEAEEDDSSEYDELNQH